MSFNLIESVKTVLSGDMTNKIAALMGESYVNVQQAINGSIPSILTGILLKAESGDIQDTMDLATDAARLDIPFNLSSLAGGTGNAQGMDLLKNLFGEKTGSLSEAIASYAGVSNQSATSLLSLVAPAALGVLGKHILDSNMNQSGLRSFLNGQRKKILDVMPVGLFLDGILGNINLTDVAEKFSVEDHLANKSGIGSKWVLPLIISLAAIGGIYYYSTIQKHPETISKPVAEPVADTAVSVKDTILTSQVPVSQYSIKLPDGTLMYVKKGGIEDQLVNFLNDPNGKPSRRFPFNFDQLSFNKGTTVISSESMKQMQNVATILKAYPKVKIKIGGFSQRGGDSTFNSNLSEHRAASVANALKAAGASSSQVTGAEGFGSAFARYYAEAPDSLKEKDNRISISIRSK